MKKVIMVAAMALFTGSFAQARVIDKIRNSNLKNTPEQASQMNVKMKLHADIKAKEQPKTKTVK